MASFEPRLVSNGLDAHPTSGEAKEKDLMTHEGSCACGAVQVTADGEPAIVSICHCSQCQKRTGSTYSVHGYFPRDAVTVAGETRSHRRTADTGCHITFHFCPVCASTVDWDVEAMPDMVGIPVGVFADASFPPPTTSIFVPQKHPWVSIPEGIPQNSGHGEAFLEAARAALARRDPNRDDVANWAR